MNSLETRPGFAFVSRPSQAVDSLFTAGGTSAGLFKARKSGVLFMRLNGEPFAWLALHRSTPFFVSAFRQPGGRVKYMQGLSTDSAAALGFDVMDFRGIREAGERIAGALKAAAA